jgi:hypothetical protein
MKDPMLRCFGIGFVLVAVVACDYPDAIYDPSFGAIVRGTVTRAGTPIQGARISYSVFNATHNMQAPDYLGGAVPATTNAAGAFRSSISYFLYGPFSGLVEVRVQPPVGSGLSDSTVVTSAVPFTSEGRDSVTIQIAYP